jgi:hypothetical protein
MPVITAKQSMGFCHCGVQIEAGETVSIENNHASHVGCSRKLEQLEPKKEKEIRSGYLFSDLESATIERAKEVIGAQHISFDGATVLQIDTARLATQIGKVFELMRDGKYRTLAQIAAAAGCLETSASARLRDFRKARFGSHEVVSRQVAGSPLLFEYRLIVNERKEIDAQRSAA